MRNLCLKARRGSREEFEVEKWPKPLEFLEMLETLPLRSALPPVLVSDGHVILGRSGFPVT